MANATGLDLRSTGADISTRPQLASQGVAWKSCPYRRWLSRLHADLADGLLVGKIPIAQWSKSQNAYDWLGEGIYFWEHSPGRALRWATEQFRRRAAVVGTVIQLGACFDLLDENVTSLLAASYPEFEESFTAAGRPMPVNKGKDKKLRELDCAVINDCLMRMARRHIPFDTVRGAFLEGPPAFPGTAISAETHIQIAVLNVDCILGVFRPNL